MQFWKKYKAKKQLRKAKKELKQKLEKARFINFYDNKIDLKDGKPVMLQTFSEEYIERHYGISTNYAWKNYIFLNYFDENKGYFKRTWHYGKNGTLRDEYFDKLNDFMNSDKFTERLNEYEQLEKEYELL
jgi:hypothetical protein